MAPCTGGPAALIARAVSCNTGLGAAILGEIPMAAVRF
jgi:hypothetical protein